MLLSHPVWRNEEFALLEFLILTKRVVRIAQKYKKKILELIHFLSTI